MPVETVTFISDLEPDQPRPSDRISSGDDHIRNIKQGIKNTFPNIDNSVEATDEELNFVKGVTQNIAESLQALNAADGALDSRVTKNEQDIAQNSSDIAANALSIMSNTAKINDLTDDYQGHTIGSHADVDLNGITKGCALVWDGAKWIAKKVGGGMLTLVEQPATVGEFSIKQGSYSKPATDDIYYAAPVTGNKTVTFTVPAGKVFVMDYIFCLGYVNIDLNSIKVDGVTMMPGSSGSMMFDSPFDEDFEFAAWPTPFSGSSIRVEQSVQFTYRDRLVQGDMPEACISGLFVEA